ncbi:MAG: polyprenyl synthetase family protein [Clostridia bacterium]|nr:polyprenyl synthetase family protein [Clostridia bacterium]
MKTLKEYAAIINDRLETIIPKGGEGLAREGDMPGLLAESMRYSLLAGGKRLRPAMLLAAVDMLGGDINACLDFACAVEMIHNYSLIHDDLPGMDNDTMRRGRPTNHVVFGEGQAILAGDGLLNMAFEVMLSRAVALRRELPYALDAINEIAIGSGVTGMIARQVMDLYCEHNRVHGEAELSYIQRNKTACMFIYPLRAAGWLSGADQADIDALGQYGEAFGRLFQATDDLLDVIGDTAEMGKTLGKDAQQGKLTMIAMHGVEGTRSIVLSQRDAALAALDRFGARADFFRDLINAMVSRTN